MRYIALPRGRRRRIRPFDNLQNDLAGSKLALMHFCHHLRR
jgi:hypothetical protein